MKLSLQVFFNVYMLEKTEVIVSLSLKYTLETTELIVSSSPMSTLEKTEVIVSSSLKDLMTLSLQFSLTCA
jgi:hypothetical protein